MGANFDYRTYKNTGKEHVKKQWDEDHSQDLYDNGHSYSGGIGMTNGVKWLSNVFKTFEEAENYVMDNAEKWEEALAVRYQDEKGEEHYLIGGWCSS